MFRLNFKVLALFVVSVAGLLPRPGVAEIVQERMGPDGFPKDWKASDFAIGKEIISKTVVAGAVSGTGMVAGGVSGSVLPPMSKGAVEGIGVLKLGTGGESSDVWQKQSRADAEAGLIRAVAQGVASPGLKEGWRRLLLSEAAAPQTTDKGVRSNWLAVRAGTMEKMGLYEAAWGLWREVPQSALGDDALAEGWVEAKLLAGQGNEGCMVAKSHTVAGATGGNWPIVMAVCQLVAPNAGSGANTAAASLSLQIVEPILRGRNPPLLRILNAVQDGKPVMTLNGPTAMVDGLGGTVLAAYPALVGPDILPRLPDMALRRLSESKELPDELRGRAAVALARQTGLPQDGKAAWSLVSATTFAGALPDAVVVAKGMDTSGTYVQSALRLGEVDAAAKALPVWLKVGGLNASDNRIRVQAQLSVAALQGKVDDKLWDTWLVAQLLENQAGVRQAQRTLLVVEGLGVGVPGRVWQQMRDRAIPVSTLVDPAWQRLLAGAVHDENMPAVLGLISEAWVGQPPAGVVPVVMGASVEALRRVGMEDVARRVAAEAMLGIPASHLIPLVPEALPPVSGTNIMEQPQTLIGADAVSGTVAPVTPSTTAILPPPRIKAPTMPVVKRPVVKAPTRPTMPKVNG